MEIANAFNELNNPTDQLERFAAQAMLKEGGDVEACEPDYDFVRALEYGMPPTSGMGMGYGLPGTKRLVDRFEIQTEKGKGTIVRVMKWK